MSRNSNIELLLDKIISTRIAWNVSRYNNKHNDKARNDWELFGRYTDKYSTILNIGRVQKRIGFIDSIKVENEDDFETATNGKVWKI